MQEIARGPLAAPSGPLSLPSSPGKNSKIGVEHPPALETSFGSDPQRSLRSEHPSQRIDVPLGPAFAAAAVLTSSLSAAAPGMQGIPSPTRSVLHGPCRPPGPASDVQCVHVNDVCFCILQQVCHHQNLWHRLGILEIARYNIQINSYYNAVALMSFAASLSLYVRYVQRSSSAHGHDHLDPRVDPHEVR